MKEIWEALKTSLVTGSGGISPATIFSVIIGAFLIGALIYVVYRFFHKSVVYSASFNATLPLMTVISSVIILCVSSNLAFSLGALGALSIIRFRTAVKDPIDLSFLFWSIAAGITVGAELYALAIYGNLAVAAAVILFTGLKRKDKNYLLVINCGTDAEKKVFEALKEVKYTLRTKNITGENEEITVEIRLNDKNIGVTDIISKQDGVLNVSLVSYNGDFAV